MDRGAQSLAQEFGEDLRDFLRSPRTLGWGAFLLKSPAASQEAAGLLRLDRLYFKNPILPRFSPVVPLMTYR